MSRRLIGMLAGWATWVAFVAMAFYYRDARKFVPQSVRDVSDFLMLGVELAALPVGLGGWIWVWGDAGPPWWAKGWAQHVAIGLIVFGTVGALGSSLFTRRQFGLRALLIAMTLIVLVLGLAAAAKQAL
jgi:hypothetical protein